MSKDVKAAIKGRWLGFQARVQRWVYRKLPIESRFSQIYKNNSWGDNESVSGSGSNLVQTRVIREQIPILLQKINAQSMLDVPCGDFHWMKETHLNIEKYIGGDIVVDLTTQNQQRFGDETKEFCTIDITKSEIPQVDVIFCRDCLVHLSFEDIMAALGNFKRSGSRYLLTTTFTKTTQNRDIITGEWRPLNLTLSPFNLPEPLEIINEHCTEGGGKYGDKSLGLWALESIIS